MIVEISKRFLLHVTMRGPNKTSQKIQPLKIEYQPSTGGWYSTTERVDKKKQNIGPLEAVAFIESFCPKKQNSY